MPFLQKKTLSNKKFDFWSALPWVWLLMAYGITMGFLALHGRGYIDSDMASEMVLADLLNNEGGIFSKNWGYSTEIRVFFLQVVYRITLLIFPHNWYAAHMLGQAIWMLLLIFSVLFAGRSLGLKGGGVWAAGAMACPFGMWYFWYGAFGGFYVPHMILLLVSFGLAVRFAMGRGQKKAVQAVLLALLAGVSFISGLGSIKGILAIYLPMAAAAVILVLLQVHREPQKLPVSGLRYLVCGGLSTAFAGAGYLINSTLLAANYTFRAHNDRLWGSLDFSALLQNWLDFLSLLGFPGFNVVGDLETELPLFSLYGVLGALGLVLAAAAVIALISLAVRWAALGEKGLMLLLTLGGTCLVQGAVFAFTTGSDRANPSYWLTPLPLLILAMQLAWEKAPFRFRYAREACAVAFIVCVSGCSVAAVHDFFAVRIRATPELQPAVQWLADNGYTTGYASWWNCNVATEWTNGQLDMRVVDGYTLDVTETHIWLEHLDHDRPPEGRVFLLVSAQELWGSHKESLRNENNVYWDENDYLIMAYDSYDQMAAAIAAAHADE